MVCFCSPLESLQENLHGIISPLNSFRISETHEGRGRDSDKLDADHRYDMASWLKARIEGASPLPSRNPKLGSFTMAAPARTATASLFTGTRGFLDNASKHLTRLAR